MTLGRSRGGASFRTGTGCDEDEADATALFALGAAGDAEAVEGSNDWKFASSEWADAVGAGAGAGGAGAGAVAAVAAADGRGFAAAAPLVEAMLERREAAADVTLAAEGAKAAYGWRGSAAAWPFVTTTTGLAAVASAVAAAAAASCAGPPEPGPDPVRLVRRSADPPPTGTGAGRSVFPCSTLIMLILLRALAFLFSMLHAWCTCAMYSRAWSRSEKAWTRAR